MKKMITLSNEEKSLIWTRFIQTVNGTQDEAEHFFKVCEQFGLNPLLGDIVFQRYETKNGARTQFITTRDGLLRVASRQSDYVGPPNANVVKEGDHFEFLPAEGTVKHKFGSKRGKILGAYAIMKHKRHNPVAVFVDFDEYYQANSGKLNSRYGNPNVWDKMPSAMIVKIAEVFVLRRQFPLGGLYTREEMGLEEDLQLVSDSTLTQQDIKNNQPQPQQNQSKQQRKQIKPIPIQEQEKEKNSPQKKKIKVILKNFEVKESASGKSYGMCDVADKSNNHFNVLVKNDEMINELQNISLDTQLEMSVYKENSFLFLDQIVDDDFVSTTNIKQDQVEEQQQENQHDFDIIKGKIKQKQSGQKGETKFVKMVFESEDGNRLALLAHGNQNVTEAENIKNDQPIVIKVKHENGFNFFVGLHNDQKVG